MKIGVLAVQGAFIEHKKMIEGLGEECIEIRQANDLTALYFPAVKVRFRASF